MKYTPNIISVANDSGLLTVQVDFVSENGLKTVSDMFQTRSAQDEKWLDRNITRKVEELEGLDDFKETIKVGEYKAPEKIEKVVDPEVDTYKQDYEIYLKLISLLNQGIIDANNEDFKAIRKRLKDNFSIERLDIF